MFNNLVSAVLFAFECFVLYILGFLRPYFPRLRRRNDSLPRRATKGPLDAPNPDDILGASTSSISPSASQIQSPLSPIGPFSTRPSLQEDALSQLSSPSAQPPPKDFSYLLRQDIYHPISQLEIPAPFRTPLPNPDLDAPLSANITNLDNLLESGCFLAAAHLSAALLTSSLISSTDSPTIFYLLHTRLSCLELTGNTVLAAQESKSLEDLTHAFYWNHASGKPRDHIVPWALRVLAVRLQAIGFGDARRGVAGFYDLGIEARAQLKVDGITPEEWKVWKARLADLGMRVTNSLIEMGDLEAAKQTLKNVNHSQAMDAETRLRLALLLIRIGDVRAAGKIAGEEIKAGDEMEVFWPLYAMAEGRWEDAVNQWRALLGTKSGKQDEALISQNLAVCLLYTGRLWEARDLLERLVDKGHGFHSLTFNLATMYELCHEKPLKKKLGLAERVANQPKHAYLVSDKSNEDFKL